MSYAEIRAECEAAGCIREEEGLGNVCGLSGMMCNGKVCPIKGFFSKRHRQPGYYRQRALDRTGLVRQFEEEMGE